MEPSNTRARRVGGGHGFYLKPVSYNIKPIEPSAVKNVNMTMINTVSRVLPVSVRNIVLRNYLKTRPHFIKREEDNLKSIFIHIPKTAGLSISKAIFNRNIGHRKIEHLELYDLERVRSYFTFSFVRNPWDRMLSAFTFLKSGGINHRDKAWAQANLEDFYDFDSFVKALKNRRQASRIMRHKHFWPQYSFICDRNMKIRVNYVGRFERINEDFISIMNRLNIDSKLYKTNESKHNNYTEYYSQETKEIVSLLYEEDIVLLGYDFANPIEEPIIEESL